MALSPFAALSLPLVNDPAWQQSFEDVAERLRSQVTGEQAHKAGRWLDEQLTFMDWAYRVTGIDLSAAWDPEMWVRFREAVAANQPAIFWNKLLEKVQYSESCVKGSADVRQGRRVYRELGRAYGWQRRGGGGGWKGRRQGGRGGSLEGQVALCAEQRAPTYQPNSFVQEPIGCGH